MVLVVDDEEEVADTFAATLGDEYETRVVYGGEAALEAMDHDVDAVLLDRRMPDMHGDDVLAEIRDRGYDCTVVMTTAIDPDLNILEMDFDDYLSKPVLAETLRETLEQHLQGPANEPRIDEYFALVSKLDILESELPRSELVEDAEYERLREEVTSLRSQLREEIDDFDDLLETYRDIDRRG